MLKTLAFEKSLFSGVLNGGQKDIFLGGSRLTKFMESVEGAAAAIPASMGQENLNESEIKNQVNADVCAAVPTQFYGNSIPEYSTERLPEVKSGGQNSGRENPWGSLLQLGFQLLQSMSAGQAIPGDSVDARPVSQLLTPFIETDQETGTGGSECL
jgi:hypothetical protein